ncbi:unannotated protein [freshwater metagenome]|uniref:Unannotated protein n=1 Tax=freshwater metagenome TaxID=449393 RepID=A0A6J7EGT9_9ZZZZ
MAEDTTLWWAGSTGRVDECEWVSSCHSIGAGCEFGWVHGTAVLTQLVNGDSVGDVAGRVHDNDVLEVGEAVAYFNDLCDLGCVFAEDGH